MTKTEMRDLIKEITLLLDIHLVEVGAHICDIWLNRNQVRLCLLASASMYSNAMVELSSTQRTRDSLLSILESALAKHQEN